MNHGVDALNRQRHDVARHFEQTRDAQQFGLMRGTQACGPVLHTLLIGRDGLAGADRSRSSNCWAEIRV